jgi:putative hydrolase of the HAD superfamily
VNASPTPAAVLIDLYDTLVWGEWPLLRADIAARLAVPSEVLQAAYDRTRPARGVGTAPSEEEDMAGVLGALDREPDPALIAELLELERSSLVLRVHLFEDSIPVLREFRRRGARTAVVSNCSRSTRPVVDRLGLEDEVDAVVLSCEVGAVKPDPAIYRTALDRLGAIPAEAAYVDDQSVYCDGATALGMRTFLIRREGLTDPPSGSAISAIVGHQVIGDLTQLLAPSGSKRWPT